MMTDEELVAALQTVKLTDDAEIDRLTWRAAERIAELKGGWNAALEQAATKFDNIKGANPPAFVVAEAIRDCKV
jgi:hypothetical protein